MCPPLIIWFNFFSILITTPLNLFAGIDMVMDLEEESMPANFPTGSPMAQCSPEFEEEEEKRKWTKKEAKNKNLTGCPRGKGKRKNRKMRETKSFLFALTLFCHLHFFL